MTQDPPSEKNGNINVFFAKTWQSADIAFSLPEISDGPALRSSSLNVLLAEDNPVNQEVAVGLLEILDCAVTVVEDGQEAVDAASAGAFDLVLMDCQMPVMDGLEATRAIRNMRPDDERLPIVALTANDDGETKAACLAAGMDDFLAKPFSREELSLLLQRWRSSAEPLASPEPTAVTEPKTSSFDLAPIEALGTLDPNGERNLVQRAINKFVDYSDELMASLIAAIDKSDANETSRIVHSLKSSSASLGAINLAKQCADIEKRTSNAELPDDIRERSTALQAAQQAAKQHLLRLIAT